MTQPALLSGKRIAVLGSASGLGLAVARALDAAGAEVHGIDDERGFEGVAAFYRADLTDADAIAATAHALPEGLDGLALFPALPGGGPRDVLAHGLLAPRLLAASLAPRLGHGAAIVLRGAPVTGHWADCLPETRAAMALRHDGVERFVAQWGLALDPARTARTVGWALAGFAMAQRWAWAGQGVRINALSPASPDGRLPPEIVAATGQEAAAGPHHAASAALFLLSDLSRGLTGAVLAADGGLSAQTMCRLDGL